MENLAKAYRLSLYEEIIGLLAELCEENGVTFAKIGRIDVMLPIEMADTLHPHIGQKIAILRSDSPSRPYRFRIVTKNSPAGAPNTDKGDENCAINHRSDRVI